MEKYLYSMKQNREPRSKPTYLHSMSSTRRKDYIVEKRQSLQQVGAGKAGQLQVKE